MHIFVRDFVGNTYFSYSMYLLIDLIVQQTLLSQKKKQSIPTRFPPTKRVSAQVLSKNRSTLLKSVSKGFQTVWLNNWLWIITSFPASCSSISVQSADVCSTNYACVKTPITRNVATLFSIIFKPQKHKQQQKKVFGKPFGCWGSVW